MFKYHYTDKTESDIEAIRYMDEKLFYDIYNNEYLRNLYGYLYSDIFYASLLNDVKYRKLITKYNLSLNFCYYGMISRTCSIPDNNIELQKLNIELIRRFSFIDYFSHDKDKYYLEGIGQNGHKISIEFQKIINQSNADSSSQYNLYHNSQLNGCCRHVSKLNVLRDSHDVVLYKALPVGKRIYEEGLLNGHYKDFGFGHAILRVENQNKAYDLIRNFALNYTDYINLFGYLPLVIQKEDSCDFSNQKEYYRNIINSLVTSNSHTPHLIVSSNLLKKARQMYK